MKYEVVDGKLIIRGSFLNYGISLTGKLINAWGDPYIFPVRVSESRMEARLLRDQNIREEWERRGRPEDVSWVEKFEKSPVALATD